MPAVPRKSSSFSGRFNNALDRLLIKLRVDDVPHIKRIIVTVVGGTVVIFGVILIVTPGPAFLVIPVGLAILGTEYAWARRWLRKARRMAQTAISKTQEIIRPSESANTKQVPVAKPVAKASTHSVESRSEEELVGTADDRQGRR